MRIILALLLSTCVTLSHSAEISVITEADHVTIYHTGALVHRDAKVNLPAGVSDLVFKGLSSKIVLGSLKIKNKEVTLLNKQLIRKLTEEEKQQLDDKKLALQNQLTLLESKYQDAGFVEKVADLEKMMAYYAEKVQTIKRNIRQVDREIENAKKLETIQLDNEDQAILKVRISIEKALNGQLSLQYVVGGIGWSPSYEIRANSAKDRKISLKYIAKVMSQTGEDWNDVEVSLSSENPLESLTELPMPEEAWIISGHRYASDNRNEQNNVQARKQEVALLEGVEYHEINMPSFLQKRTLKGRQSIAANSTVFSFHILTTDLPAYFYYYAYPSIEQDVYLVSRMSGWDTLSLVDGVANIIFAGNDVGQSIVRFSEYVDTLKLPIGRDNGVFLQRKEIPTEMYEKESATKKRKETLAYEMKVKNNLDHAVTVQLADQIPISQTKLAEVELNETSNGQLNEETGDIHWNIVLEPGQLESRKLVFTIETDAKYRYSGRHHYKLRGATRRSVPSF